MPLGEEESEHYIADCYRRADAFLFGRRTYELFAGYWGVRDDLDNPFVGSLNSRPKYVASNTITDPQWAGTTVLSGDLESAIRDLKAAGGSRAASCRCTEAVGSSGGFSSASSSTR